jgi:hypothetical protein
MRPSALLAVPLFCACNAGPTAAPTAKSIFELTGTDFQQHQTAMVGAQPQQSIQIAKGDLIYIAASGTLSSSGFGATVGTVGPNGSDLWGGTSFPLVNRRVLALYGRIGESTFLVGTEAVILAPQDGTLELLVNACSTCTVTGSFTVDVFAKLRPEITLTQTPQLTDNTAKATRTSTLDAAQGWQSTGVMLQKGQKVFIDVSGTTGSNVSGASGSHDADGDTLIGGLSFPLVNHSILRVFGRLGDVIVDVGKSAAFLAPSAGTLELIVNAPMGQASGMLSVSVVGGVVPARGLQQADAAGFSQTGMVSVPGDQAWHASSATVHRGDPLLLSATGSTDPFGQGAVGGLSYLLVNRPVDALFGRVGTEVFFIGGANTVLAPADGPLELAVNSNATQGGFSVTFAAP